LTKAVADGLAQVLDELAEALLLVADRLRRDDRDRKSFAETVAVLHDRQALDDLHASELSEQSWDEMREDMGIGAHRSDLVSAAIHSSED
jgi:hypothetical protein